MGGKGPVYSVYWRVLALAMPPHMSMNICVLYGHTCVVLSLAVHLIPLAVMGIATELIIMIIVFYNHVCAPSVTGVMCSADSLRAGLRSDALMCRGNGGQGVQS